MKLVSCLALNHVVVGPNPAGGTNLSFGGIMKAMIVCSKCGCNLDGLTYLDAVNFKDEPRQWWYVCDKCLKKDKRKWIRRRVLEESEELYEQYCSKLVGRR